METVTKPGLAPRLIEPAPWREALAFGLPAGLLAAAVSVMGAGVHPAVPILAAIMIAAGILAALRPMTALYLGLVSVPLDATSLNVGALGVTPSEGIFTLTAVAWLLKRTAHREPVIVPSPLTAPLALGVAIMAMGFLVSEAPVQVAKVLAVWAVIFVLVQMVLAEGDARSVRRLMIAVAFAGGAFGIVAIANNGGQELAEFGRSAEGRARAAFGSPNRLGEYLALSIPCQVAVLLRGPRSLRTPMILCLGVALAGLALTLSRGAMLGLAGAFLLLLAWRPFRRAFAIAVVVVIASSLAGFNPVSPVIRPEVLLERITSIRYEAELNPRRVALQNSPEIIADHPLLGVGAGSLASVAAEYDLILNGAPMDNAHNMLLHIGAERGLLGLAAFIWLLVAFGVTVARACTRLTGENEAYAFAIAAAWLSLLLEGANDSVLQQNAIAATAFVFMAAAVVLARQPVEARAAGPEGAPASQPSRRIVRPRVDPPAPVPGV